jgi:pantetheine-phosphate adenylyltransferase
MPKQAASPTRTARSGPRQPVTAVFPGTFDPITLGHEDLIARAAGLFERLVVAVAAGHHKQTMFTLDERLAMVRRATASSSNVSVTPMDGLMVEFVQAQGAHVVVRGVRNGSDFDYEFQLAGMNRERSAEVETVFLMPNVKHQFVSSTRVREIASLGGEVRRFVSRDVLAAMRLKVQTTTPSNAGAKRRRPKVG